MRRINNGIGVLEQAAQVAAFVVLATVVGTMLALAFLGG